MIKYCDIGMDHNSIVQELVASDDKVVSTVECTWNETFKILALVEHPNWDLENSGNFQRTGQRSPESREFVILVLDGKVPIKSRTDLDLIHIVPITGSNSFSCEIDMESGQETEICVKISPSLIDDPILVKMASGNRSQNFIDEVFRSAQIASKGDAREFPWLNYYENMVSTSSHLVGTGGSSGDRSLEFQSGVSEGIDDEGLVGMGGRERESIARGITSLRGRETMVKCVLDSKQEQYIDLKPITVYIASWNVNGQSPGSICLTEWLARNTPNEPPDIYAIGFQELDLSKEAFLFNDTPKEDEWRSSVKAGLHPGDKYRQVKLIRLVGMMLIVYAKEHLLKEMSNIIGEVVGTGLLGKMGNKGGVSVRFDIHETSMCFVNCHLAAHVEEFQRRNQDYQQISNRLVFQMADGLHYIKDHDQIFWFGDMNYRINPHSVDAEKAKLLIEKEKYSSILEQDQLKEQMGLGHVFRDFTEGSISFRPTYKYDPGTDNWDSSEKHRSPAWCDRILWKGKHISQNDYVSIGTYKLSDHKPVSSIFIANVKVVNQSRYRKVYEEALKLMDKVENEFLPQVTVDIPGVALLQHSNRNEIHFGRIKFLEPVKKSFTVANTGQVPVRLEFIKKLNDSYICKDWLSIQPISSFINPGETCEIELQVLVDKRSAANLNVGKDSLYDILVLHLESGKDIFITVAGDFERSVFGCSIAALINMSEPISNVNPGRLIELEKGRLPINHYGIPKELWFLVDRLHKYGMDKESLFSQSGLQDEILHIRDWLDVIPNTEIPGSIDSVAEVLLLLLESFPEPVIPTSLHLKCLDSSSNYTACRRLLKQLPQAHRNVFIYLLSFLRELLLHADNNGLDPKVLALLFGRVMLRDHHNSKPNQKIERQKATFIYQFLVNEDCLITDVDFE